MSSEFELYLQGRIPATVAKQSIYQKWKELHHEMFKYKHMLHYITMNGNQAFVGGGTGKRSLSSDDDDESSDAGAKISSDDDDESSDSGAKMRCIEVRKPPILYKIPDSSVCPWTDILMLFQSSYHVPPLTKSDLKHVPDHKSQVIRLLSLFVKEDSDTFIGTNWLRPQPTMQVNNGRFFGWVNLSEYWNSNEGGIFSTQNMRESHAIMNQQVWRDDDNKIYNAKVKGVYDAILSNAQKNYRLIDFIEFLDGLCYAYNRFQQYIKMSASSSSSSSSKAASQDTPLLVFVCHDKDNYAFKGECYRTTKSGVWIALLLLYITCKFKLDQWSYPDFIVYNTKKSMRKVFNYIKEQKKNDHIQFVFCDDCIYSGEQMGNNMKSLKKLIADLDHSNISHSIHMVVPFCTSFQERQTHSWYRSLESYDRVQTHSGRPETSNIKFIYDLLVEQNILHFIKDDEGQIKWFRRLTLVLFEHKFPDHYSVDQRFLDVLTCGPRLIKIKNAAVTKSYGANMFFRHCDRVEAILTDKDVSDSEAEEEEAS